MKFNFQSLTLARAVTVPRRFEAEKISHSAGWAEEHSAENDGVKIIRTAFDAFHYKTVNRVFADEPSRADGRCYHDINVSLFAF